MQVLILEDEEQSQKALERILGECSPGIRILKAQSFGAAKTLLEKSGKIDLFLLDVNLGGEETNDILGFAFAEEIRNILLRLLSWLLLWHLWRWRHTENSTVTST